MFAPASVKLQIIYNALTAHNETCGAGIAQSV
jgi:hypothetical protein